MSNVVSSAIFCARNVDKAENQNKTGRWAVAAGQGKNVIDHVQNLDHSVGKSTKSFVEVLKGYADSSKVVEMAGKTIKFASKNVNPLICVSSGIDVLKSDDKVSSTITNVTALGVMFAVEKQMKTHLDGLVDLPGIKNVAEKLKGMAQGTKFEKALPSMSHGVSFVIGSCVAYSIGEKFGSLLAKGVTGRDQNPDKS